MPSTPKNKVRITQEQLKALVVLSDEEIAKRIRELVAKGRPSVMIDINKLRLMKMAGCSLKEIAATLNVGVQTIMEHIEDDEFLRDIMEHGEEAGLAAIRMTQYAKAVIEKDTAMLIWQGKNRLGQRDRQEITGANGGPLNVVITMAEAKY